MVAKAEITRFFPTRQYVSIKCGAEETRSSHLPGIPLQVMDSILSFVVHKGSASPRLFLTFLSPSRPQDDNLRRNGLTSPSGRGIRIFLLLALSCVRRYFLSQTSYPNANYVKLWRRTAPKIDSPPTLSSCMRILFFLSFGHAPARDDEQETCVSLALFPRRPAKLGDFVDLYRSLPKRQALP